MAHYTEGLDHAISGNLSNDEMVIELTNLSKKTTKNYRTTSRKEDMDGQNWRGLKQIAFG